MIEPTFGLLIKGYLGTCSKQQQGGISCLRESDATRCVMAYLLSRWGSLNGPMGGHNLMQSLGTVRAGAIGTHMVGVHR